MDLQAFLETYRLLNDWLKALWLVTPPVFLLGLTGLLLHHRRAKAGGGQLYGGQTIYSIAKMDDGELRVFRHVPELKQIAQRFPPMVPVPREACACADPAKRP